MASGDAMTGTPTAKPPVDLLAALKQGLENEMASRGMRYCGMCDRWWSKTTTECPACGADTDKPAIRSSGKGRHAR